MDELDETQLFERSAAAQDRLVEALIDLQETQVDAFFHASYDSCAYDEAIDRYRQAKREAHESREAWERLRRAHRGRGALSAAVAPAGALAPAAPAASAETESVVESEIEATPRLLFARWLYQSGRISG